MPQSVEDKLLSRIRLLPLPRHIAVIMDGNGRWAKSRGLPRIFGHRAGTKSVREIVTACAELNLEVLTLFAFSTENWSRPRTEVNALMKLLCAMLKRELEVLHKNQIRLRTIGCFEELPREVQTRLSNSVNHLSNNNGLILNLALNYGGRREIVSAANRAWESGIKILDEKNFPKFLDTKGLPDPDLIIRTSGEMRISNFLLWQMAYSELYVTDVLWPDFKRKNLYEAILDYQNRERRFGKT